MNHKDQRDVEQALAIADDMNAYIINRPIKVSARLQYIAHLISAVGLAAMNDVSLDKTIRVLRDIHKEMVRTAKEKHKPKLSVVSSSIKKEISNVDKP